MSERRLRKLAGVSRGYVEDLVFSVVKSEDLAPNPLSGLLLLLLDQLLDVFDVEQKRFQPPILAH